MAMVISPFSLILSSWSPETDFSLLPLAIIELARRIAIIEMKSIFFILNLLAVIIRGKGKDENKKGEKHKAIFLKETKIRDYQLSDMLELFVNQICEIKNVTIAL